MIVRHVFRVEQIGPSAVYPSPVSGSTIGVSAALTADIIALATQYGRYGYRRITAMLRRSGWVVNRKRVERIWRREGLKVPQKQPKRGRLWCNENSCITTTPSGRIHPWATDHPRRQQFYGRPRIPGQLRRPRRS